MAESKDVSPLLSSANLPGKSENLSVSLFEEVKKELDLVPRSSHVSLGRQKYSDEQIN
ncbi:hypothetical protein YC2023_055771 [Brassica napus]